MCLVEIIYSFKISSTPLDLLSLSDLIAVLISLSCIGSLRFHSQFRTFEVGQKFQY